MLAYWAGFGPLAELITSGPVSSALRHHATWMALLQGVCHALLTVACWPWVTGAPVAATHLELGASLDASTAMLRLVFGSAVAGSTVVSGVVVVLWGSTSDAAAPRMPTRD